MWIWFRRFTLIRIRILLFTVMRAFRILFSFWCESGSFLFHSEAGPNPAFHILGDSDPESSSKWRESVIIGLQTLHGSSVSFHSTRLSTLLLIRIRFSIWCGSKCAILVWNKSWDAKLRCDLLEKFSWNSFACFSRWDLLVSTYEYIPIPVSTEKHMLLALIYGFLPS